jgi:hypothetical protein
MSKRTPRCSCVCADGSQCGRTVVDGSQPPICHIHRSVAAGNPHNGGTTNPRKARTPEEVIELLMHSKDESIRLRAADAYLKRQEAQRDCLACKSRQEGERDNTSAIQRLTYAQRSEVKELIALVGQIVDLAKTQPMTWDVERMCYVDEPVDTTYNPS